MRKKLEVPLFQKTDFQSLILQSQKNGFTCKLQGAKNIAFAYRPHSTAVFNLNCSLVFYFKSFYTCFLSLKKHQKRPSPAKSVITAFCSRAAGRHPSVGCYLPQTAFRSSIGDKTTRFSRNNSIAYMHRSNKFCPVSAACPAVCCDFDGAGFSFTLPLYAVKSVIQARVGKLGLTSERK